MAGLEQIATSNNEQNEAPKNAQLKEVKDGIDYNDNSIDITRVQEFKKMTDDIKRYGGEYVKEYNDIMNRIITPFEEKFQKIIDNNKESRDLNSMSNEELNNAANERMAGQPERLEGQQELFKKITNEGLTEEVQQLYEMVNNNMADVQNFYNRIMTKADGVTMPGESEPISASSTEPGSAAPEQGSEGNSGSEGGIPNTESSSAPNSEPGSVAPEQGSEGNSGSEGGRD